MDTFYRNPTLERAACLELQEKRGCGICWWRRVQVVGGARCSCGKQYPACRKHKKGFALDMGVDMGRAA